MTDAAAVRAVNDGIRDLTGGGERSEPRAFVCECGDPDCSALVRLSVEEYDEVRRGAGLLLVGRDHAAPDGTRRLRANDRFAVLEPVHANGATAEPLRVRLRDEHHAAAVARELCDLAGLELLRVDGGWEVTVDSPMGDGLVVRVLNAVSTALAGEPTATALVLLDGREYEIQGR